MTPAYLDSARFYANVTAGWMDISAYVMDMSATCKWGMNGSHPINNRIADIGEMNLTLNNASGYFGGTNLLDGWGEGTEILLELTYETHAFRRFRGRVYSAPWKPAEWGGMVQVRVTDWMRIALEFPIETPAIKTNQTIDQAVTDLLGWTPIQPQASDLDSGDIIFPYSFDSVRDRKSWGFAELNQLNLSEFGYAYLTKDQANGETLRVERQTARYGWRAVDEATYSDVSDGSALALMTGDHLKLMGGGKLLLNKSAASATFSDVMLTDQLETVRTEVINRVTVTAYPTATAASPQVLFTLNYPVPVASGQTIVIHGNYANPSGGAPINGSSMITPVATTDYLVNTDIAGGGTDITADIVVTPHYWSATFDHQITNFNALGGWVTFFQCRGYGITRDNPVSQIVSNVLSVAARGERNARLDQRYNKATTSGEWIAESTVELYKDQRGDIAGLAFCPSASRQLMYMFLQIDAGWLIRVVSTLADIDGTYYVQGVRFVLKSGGLVESASYILKPALSILP